MRATAEQRQQAGIKLQELAEEYKNRSWHLSDKDAFYLAMLAKPDLAEAYTGRAVRRDGAEEVRKFLSEGTSRLVNPSSIVKLKCLVELVPTMDGGGKDWNAIVRKIFEYPPVVKAAARETMDKLIEERVSQQRSYAWSKAEAAREAESDLRVKYPELSRLLDNPNNLNERAIRFMLGERA